MAIKTKKQKLIWVIAGGVFVALFLIEAIAFSPILLGMELTYARLATIFFRIGFVFWGLAAAMIFLRKPMVKWLNEN